MEKITPIKRALISVSDKTGLLNLARSLIEMGIQIISTGGTEKFLKDANLEVFNVSLITKFPEIMDGRVKTLHPNIHGGLLALRHKVEHSKSMIKYDIPEIDLLIVNLYPFEKSVIKDNDYDKAIENIDVGGPAMIRAAAKNVQYLSTIVDVNDYDELLKELIEHNGGTTLQFRKKMSQIAFSRTAEYDSIISNWLANTWKINSPRRYTISGKKEIDLRYGENPHQRATLYSNSLDRCDVLSKKLIQGKELSYNNINDLEAASKLVNDLVEKPAAVIVKHANPCGVAMGETCLEAYKLALNCDRTSAFGGIVAFNKVLDAKTASAVIETFTEAVIAPGVDLDAIEIFSRKKNLRLLISEKFKNDHLNEKHFKQISGGFLVQDKDMKKITINDLEIVSEKKPSKIELENLMFAWKIVKHTKSNAIVFAKNLATIGIGAGQMSRFDSSRIARTKAKDMSVALGYEKSVTIDSVVASDAFFPFPDGVIELINSGVSAIIQPGGSLNDQKIIDTVNKAKISMVFTGFRHFTH